MGEMGQRSALDVCVEKWLFLERGKAEIGYLPPIPTLGSPIGEQRGPKGTRKIKISSCLGGNVE